MKQNKLTLNDFKNGTFLWLKIVFSINFIPLLKTKPQRTQRNIKYQQISCQIPLFFKFPDIEFPCHEKELMIIGRFIIGKRPGK